jgi:hypothetical protein
MSKEVTAADSLIKFDCKPKTGREWFRAGDRMLDFELSEFWRWSMSDLVSNATRGRLAEFIVAKALSISTNHSRRVGRLRSQNARGN